MKRTLITLFLSLVAVSYAMAWDNRSHSTIARIAERHLTPRAKANIERYIDGQSVVYYASWMDHNRQFPPYDVTHDWHVDYWTDDQRADAEGNPLPPQSVSNVKRIISEMGDFRSMPDSVVNINIKYLVHLVGDIHCPVHVDFPKYRPMKIKWGKETIKYHKFYDCYIVALKHKNASPLALAEELDRADEAQRAALQASTPDDWHNETLDAAKRSYELLPEDKVITDTFLTNVIPIAERQIIAAGYRLAHVFNTIFDK